MLIFAINTFNSIKYIRYIKMKKTTYNLIKSLTKVFILHRNFKHNLVNKIASVMHHNNL